MSDEWRWDASGEEDNSERTWQQEKRRLAPIWFVSILIGIVVTLALLEPAVSLFALRVPLLEPDAAKVLCTHGLIYNLTERRNYQVGERNSRGFAKNVTMEITLIRRQLQCTHATVEYVMDAFGAEGTPQLVAEKMALLRDKFPLNTSVERWHYPIRYFLADEHGLKETPFVPDPLEWWVERGLCFPMAVMPGFSAGLVVWLVLDLKCRATARTHRKWNVS